jgi:hypothetical protein
MTLTKKKRFRWRQCSSIWPPSEYTSTSFPPSSCRGQCVQSPVMTSVQADWAAAVKRWRYLRPTRSDTAATNSVIGTTKPCFHRHPTHPDQSPLSQAVALVQTKPAISPAAEVGHGHQWCHWNHRAKARSKTPLTPWPEVPNGARILMTPPPPHLNGRSYIYFPARLIRLKGPPPWVDGRQMCNWNRHANIPWSGATDTSRGNLSAFPPNWSVLKNHSSERLWRFIRNITTAAMADPLRNGLEINYLQPNYIGPS